MNPTDHPIGPGRLVRRSLTHRPAISLAVALGVAVAGSVILGALVVGDSLRGSLRELTLGRLGRIESIIVPGTFFHPADLVVKSELRPEPIILLPGGFLEISGNGSDLPARRRGSMQVLGVDPSFWLLRSTGPTPAQPLADDTVVLNAEAAAALNLAVGDEVNVRLPTRGAVPADSPLGRQDIETEGLPRMRVAQILPNEGLGRFSLSADQAPPRLVYLSRSVIGEVLERPGDCNALLFDQPVATDSVRLTAAAAGLKIQRIDRDDVIDYFSVTGDSLVLDPAIARAITTAMPDGSVQPVVAYLANAIRQPSGGEAVVPYSIVAAVDRSDDLPLDYGGVVPAGRTPAAVNSFVAERLGVGVGDDLELEYFAPETVGGQSITRTLSVTITQVVAITEPVSPYRRNRPAKFDAPITPFNDPAMTPEVPGVTDQRSISDWDLPFKLEYEVASADDDYWNNHRLTPKVFVPLAAGRAAFGSRFGDVTGLRIDPSAAVDVDQLRAKIDSAVAAATESAGWAPVAIRDRQLTASAGTTPFDALFLSLSFFVIVAAVMLIVLLLRLGLVGRRREVGLLLATGWSPASVRRLFLTEYGVIITAGVLMGVAGGLAYAAAVLWALRTLWVGAVTVPFLQFHVTPRSVLLGTVITALVAAAAAFWTLRGFLAVDPASLVGGRPRSFKPVAAGSRRFWPSVLAVVIAAVAVAIGSGASAMVMAGSFFAAGLAILGGGLWAVILWLRSPETAAGHPSLTSLMASGIRRAPSRSALSIGLMAVATFMILSMSVFRLTPTESGIGGFDLIATPSQPIARDLGDADVRSGLFGPDAAVFRDSRVAVLRRRAGDDASCNNLYRAQSPTVIGIRSGEVLERFDWASVADRDQIFERMNRPAAGTADDPIAMVLDQNTAMWSLQIGGGAGGDPVSFEYDGRQLWFQVVGLLANSVLQGQLIIAENNFTTAFPELSGYGLFLIDTRSPDRVAEVLDRRMPDAGWEIEPTIKVLSELLAVQNTYLRTFQTLGALGLLLGTAGLAIAQTRSVIERRGELAVMRAVGFGGGRLARLIVGEVAVLLAIGLSLGIAATLVAVLPHAIATGAVVRWTEIAAVLVVITAAGLISTSLAVVEMLRAPLLASLRGSGEAAAV